ncbi:MAG: response regulator transcription factor [Prosthecobacter sp.]|nr:response regulator transcription factor [Prosthecobacter sp.]
MRVLVVEDEKKMASFILKGLKEVGFLPEVCHRGDEALVRILSSAFDAVVLDIMLPGLDGLAIVRRMRSQGCTTPVLMLSARGDVDERVEGIEAGADDYLAKPFAVKEVIARVRALVRRASETTSHTLRLADLSFDLSRREVSRAGKRLELSAREMLLLEVLMKNAGRVCGRMLLLEKVWDYNFDPGSNLVDVYIMRLRSKIDSSSAVKLLHTVRGSGYTLREGAA